ncbi:MAG: hypothetical protein CSA10_00960 [Cardiobacteriales bacterium]|nr:MAG: hypothetical protein CSA10_00960 [Cardiobacteriales bacterium]
MCPLADGSQTIIETDTPPNENCISFGVKGGGEAPAKTQASTDNTTSKTAEVSAEIATLDTPPQDIYKCFDHQGRATYVGENERHKFKQCSFFSRSFAGVEAELKRRAVSTQTLTQLAISGVNAPQLPSAKAAIKCSGAGEVIFNGEVKTYNCASRSFDYSPGSTGGSVQLGAQQATIAAHRLDYFDSAGSCGGTVLAENGRILHLEPTKECPEAFKIEARRIAAVVEKSLSINVSGAFKDRQRGLAAQINEIATNIGVDPFLVHAVISAESAYKSRAISHAGAQGLMQLMPATASRFGVTDPFNTGQNIRGGTTYLKWLLQEFNGNLELAIAGYNAGEGNVRKYGYKIPPFIETRAYVPKVLEYYRRYRANPSEVGL